MKVRNVTAYVVEFFHKHPRQDLSREEIVEKVWIASGKRYRPPTITRAISQITELNKDGIVHSDIQRLSNGKFKYVPKSATLDQFL